LDGGRGDRKEPGGLETRKNRDGEIVLKMRSSISREAELRVSQEKRQRGAYRVTTKVEPALSGDQRRSRGKERQKKGEKYSVIPDGAYVNPGNRTSERKINSWFVKG